MSALKIKPGDGDGIYDLFAPNGEKVGEVRKKVEHYNIRSGNNRDGITMITWLAWYRGQQVKPDWSNGWRRRRDAVAYLEYRFAEGRQ